MEGWRDGGREAAESSRKKTGVANYKESCRHSTRRGVAAVRHRTRGESRQVAHTAQAVGGVVLPTAK